jgi:hypothetical protein
MYRCESSGVGYLGVVSWKGSMPEDTAGFSSGFRKEIGGLVAIWERNALQYTS